MRITFKIQIDINRTNKADTPEAPSLLDVSGSQVEMSPQPRYIGFTREDEQWYEDRK